MDDWRILTRSPGYNRPMAPRGRVLVVDDDLVVGETFSRMLAVAGYDTSVATSAADGLAHARRDAPDAVIVDFRMPGSTGLGFLTSLRGDAALRDLPVAVVTGDRFLNERTLAELQALGAAVCYKPLVLGDLVRLMRDLMGRSGDGA